MNTSAQLFYSIPTYAIVLALLVLVFGAIALGSRLGSRHASRRPAEAKSQVSAVRGSLMGLLALLVGFSFSLAIGRFNDRSAAVVTEANAIGTAWLRTDLLDGPARDALRDVLADYAESRLVDSGYNIYQLDAHESEVSKSNAAFGAAWAIAAEAARGAPNPATVAVAMALNDMTDSYASNEAALNLHVPEAVLVMLLMTLLFLAWVVGYASADEGMRTPAPMLLMMALIVLLQAMVLDLDRPRRGVIRVDQAPMIGTVTNILTEMGRAVPSGN